VPQRDIDRRNLERAQELAARPLTDETVAFTGPFGVGKTYLASCLLLAQIRQHGKRGLYLTTNSYVRMLMPEGADPETQRGLRSRARSVDVLLLDDLGVEKSSAFAMRELWDLLHHRTSNGLATIVTSNLTIREALQGSRDTKGLPADAREAAELGQRIFSRLAETRVPPINWPEGSTDMRFDQQGATVRRPDLRDSRRELRRGLVDDSILDDES
jgi:DNA replication protein DnaC